MSNPSPFTSEGYPFSKNLKVYNATSLGRAFFSDGYTAKIGGFELFDNSNIFTAAILKDEPLFYKKTEISVTVFTTGSNSEFVEKYNKLALNYDEIAIFLVQSVGHTQASVAIALGDSLLKLSNLKKNAPVTNLLPALSAQQISTVGKSLSGKALISLLNIGNKIFNDDTENISGLTEEKSYTEVEEAFKTLYDDYGAGYVNKEKPHAFAHGDIELKALLPLNYKELPISQIYYGNWLRDFSQLIVKATLGSPGKAIDELSKKATTQKEKQALESAKSKLTHDSLLQIVELLAVHEFVYADRNNKGEPKKGLRDNYADLKKTFNEQFGKLTKDTLGIYRPEEHIDNPKGLVDESKYASFSYEKSKGKFITKTLYNGENPLSLTLKDNMKYYILNDVDETKPSSFTYFAQQFTLARKKGKTREGFCHLGAALHVLEDYFAHSNFIEIALIKQKYDVYPWVQLDDKTRKMKPGPEKAKKIPLVTGLFSTDDSIASIAPKVAAKLFPIKMQPYAQRKPGDRTFFDTLIKCMLTDFADKEKNLKNKTTYGGLTYQDLLDLYNNYLAYLDTIAELEKDPIKGLLLRLYRVPSHYIAECLKFFPKLAFNLFINSIDDAIKEGQTNINKNYGTNPTHTQVAKDPEDHPLNELSALLAIEAVNKVCIKMEALWNNKKSSIAPVLNEIRHTYFNHPSEVNWMASIITAWLKTSGNQKKINKVKDPSFVNELHKEAETKRQELSLTNNKIRKIYDAFKKGF